MVKKYRNKLIVICIIIAVLTTVQFVLPDYSKVVGWYNSYIFKPFQTFRNTVFNLIPFSVGDLLYILGCALLGFTIGKWIYFLFRLKKHKHDLALSILQTLNTCGIIYIIFLLGWGGNYYKSSLSDYWKLPKEDTVKNDSLLLTFDNFLVDKLNEYAPLYKTRSFRQIDQCAKDFYQQYTNHTTQASKAKASVFGNAMQYVRIQGYYNPFTGEAQVNKNLPAFMLPFVICHEIAHQQGIAAEDDANLLSYAVSTLVPDNAFRYSAYFNIWLYTHRRLYSRDSLIANQQKEKLNRLTKEHIQQLIALRNKYNSDLSDYSGAIYDGYLKMHHQNEGIRSYNKVWKSAFALEEKRKITKDTKIQIP